MDIKDALRITVMLTVFKCKYRRQSNDVLYCKLRLAIITANYAIFKLMKFQYGANLVRK